MRDDSEHDAADGVGEALAPGAFDRVSRALMAAESKVRGRRGANSAKDKNRMLAAKRRDERERARKAKASQRRKRRQ